MKTKIIQTLLLTIVYTFITACGGGGGQNSQTSTSNSISNSSSNDSNTQNSSSTNQTQTRSVTVSGVAFDGPIYDAIVKVCTIEDINCSNPLFTTTTSSEDGKVGTYNININDSDLLPENYIVKIYGGKDAGADGEVDSLDKNSTFELSTIGDKNTSDSTHITPATTLITQTFIDSNDTNILNKLKDAKEITQKALGIEENLDLTKLDPTIEPVAAKAAYFVAGVIKSMPTNDINNALKSTANIMKKNVESNKSLSNISNDGSFSITNEFNLTEIATDLNLSTLEIQKMEKASIAMEKLIEDSVQEFEPTSLLNDVEKEELKATLLTFEKITDDIKKVTDLDEISSEKINTLAKNSQQALNAILKTNKDKLNDKNIDIVLNMVEKNNDKNISDLTTELIQITAVTHTVFENNNSDDSIKLMMKDMYENIELNNSESINTIGKIFKDDASIVKMKEQIKDITSDENTTLLKAVAKTIVTKANKGEESFEDNNFSSIIESTRNLEEAYRFMDRKYLENDKDKILFWLEQTLVRAVSKNSNVDVNMSNLYSDINNSLAQIENNITKVYALKLAVITKDLNTTTSTIDQNTVALFENKIQSLETYDLLTSLSCIEQKILFQNYTEANLNSINIDDCKVEKIIVPKVVKVKPNLFRALDLLGELPSQSNLGIFLQY